MDETIKKAGLITLASLGLALIFNWLFFGKLIGISIFIFVVLLVMVVLGIAWREGLAWQKSWWLILLTIFFALMPGFRANLFLTFLNLCASFGLLMLLGYQLAGTPAWLMKIRDHFILMTIVPFRMLRRGLGSIALIGQIHSKVQNRDIWLRVFKAVIMAIPILIVFGVLFSQADLAFSHFLKGFVNITITQRTVHYLVLLAFAFSATLSYLSYIFFSHPIAASIPAGSDPDGNGTTPARGLEMSIFLGLIATLFLVFIIFQINYLFGGEANIAQAGFTYAEYARRGFGELVAVSILSLLILLAAEKYAGAESKLDAKFLVPALVLIAEVMVIMVSAFKRLALYIDAYSMTMMRFYVAGFIVLLAVLFILLAVKFAVQKPERFFAFGTLLSVAAFIAVLNLVNPDRIVLQKNIDQYHRTGKMDVTYIRELSTDAETDKIALYSQVGEEEKDTVRKLLLDEKWELEQFTKNWQSSNWSRSKGLQLLQQQGLGE